MQYRLDARFRTNNASLGRLRGSDEADCFCPHARLIVELDGRTYHERHASFESDRQRDWDAAVAGYTTLRLTWLRIRDEATTISADLAQLLAA